MLASIVATLAKPIHQVRIDKAKSEFSKNGGGGEWRGLGFILVGPICNIFNFFGINSYMKKKPMAF
jgi:hypothetical protein